MFVMRCVFFIFLFIAPTHCQFVRKDSTQATQNIKNPTPAPSPSPFLYTIGRLFSISEKAPMTEILQQSKSFTGNFSIVQKFVEDVETNVMTSLSEKKATLETSGRNRVCNYKGGHFRRSVEIFFEIRRLPTLQADCITEFVVPPKSNAHNKVELHHAMRGLLSTVADNQYKLADTVVGNWSTAVVARDFEYEDTAQICYLNNMGAIRVRDKWYIQIEVSNAGQYENLVGLKRQRISEFMHMASENKLDLPLIYSMYHRPPGNESHRLVQNTTTVLWSGGGQMDPNFFRKQYPDDISALSDALESSSLRVEQVNDAISLSTIGILVLPALFTLVPVAVFARVETKVMLLYLLMSDIVTVIPLAVKGIELIGIGLINDYGAAIRMTSSSDGTPTPSSAASLWTAECRPKPKIFIMGVVFLVIAITLMLIGIAIEVWSRRYAQMRKMRRVLQPPITDFISGEDDYEMASAEIGARGPS